MEEAEKQHKNNFDWLKEYQWQKGQSGNPAGRPKTRTLKEYAREFLSQMSEEGRIAYFSKMKPEDVWKMAEGNPETKTDLTSKGERILVMPLELINKNETDTITKSDSTGQA